MKKTTAYILMMLLVPALVSGQQTGDRIQREVRLYNPFRPTLSEAAKKNLFPDMTDTARVAGEINYNVSPEPFTPPYTISQIRPAAMLPDPLPKLYKSYVNMGIGNYFTPLGELSITSERSRTGMLAFYGRHFSSNGRVELQNLRKVYAGYMDNDAVVYGRKFLSSSVLSGSVDFSHLTRHAYGYDTTYTDWEAEREDTRLRFLRTGADASIASLRADSGSLIYDFSVGYDYFRQSDDLWQHDVEIIADGGRSVKSLGPSGPARRAGVSYFFGHVTAKYNGSWFDAAITPKPRHIIDINPSLSKKSNEWNFNLGLRVVTESRMYPETPADEYKTRFHIYPDVSLNIAVIPRYLTFGLSLDGNLESNSAPVMALVNPYVMTDGSLFRMPYTDNQIIAGVVFTGSMVPSTSYRAGGTYTVFSDRIFFSNVVWDGLVFNEGVGNFFTPVPSDGNVANLYGEFSSEITSRLNARLRADYYHYTLTDIDFAYNQPAFDGSLQLRYNLRDKIIAGAGLKATGPRTAFITPMTMMGPPPAPRDNVELPMHLNMNLTAEYRYTKILSFWLRAYNISFSRNYEWAFYPSQRFLMMAGFSYSL